MGLSELREKKDRKESELSSKEREKAGYEETAEQIHAIYERMAAKKSDMKQLKQNLATFKDKSYDGFKGNVFESTYIVQIDELISKYNVMIAQIDDNMDALNMQQAYYENKAYQCEGVIGYLRSIVNELAHEIRSLLD